MDKKRSEVDETCTNYGSELQQLLARQQQLTDDKFQLEREKQKSQGVLEETQMKFDQRMKDFEYEKEKEAVYLGDR